MDSDLYNAVIGDNIDVFKEMNTRLSIGDQVTPTNNTVLHLACQYGSIECVIEILRVHESLLMEINSRNETSLHLAARYGDSNVVKALIDKAKSMCHLQPSSLQDTTSMLQFLIRTENVEFETALHAAVRYNHGDIVQLLIEADPSHSHSQNKHKETPLYLASIRCYPHIIRKILDICISPTFGGPDGRNALHAAVLYNGGHECVKLLLENNKNLVKEVDDYGWTAFHYVAFNDLYTIVEDLVGADKSAGYVADKEYKRTALHLAAYKGNIRVMKKLLEYYPDTWDILDGKDQNILHLAVDQYRSEVTSFILSQSFGASNGLLIQRDKEGNTPLHLIPKLRFFDYELVGMKIDWEVLDDKNLTPLDLLFLNRNDDSFRPINYKLLRKLFISAKVNDHGHLWPTLKEPDVEKGITILRNGYKYRKEKLQERKNLINTQMVVAALIATVAMTAGFAMPGGFDGNQGQNQGSAVLLRKRAFQGFIIADTIALLCSVSSLLLYFLTTMEKSVYKAGQLGKISVKFNIVAMVAMMLAFIMGTYAVLRHSSALAISVCFISSTFFLLTILLSSGRFILPIGIKFLRWLYTLHHWVFSCGPLSQKIR